MEAFGGLWELLEEVKTDYIVEREGTLDHALGLALHLRRGVVGGGVTLPLLLGRAMARPGSDAPGNLPESFLGGQGTSRKVARQFSGSFLTNFSGNLPGNFCNLASDDISKNQLIFFKC